MTEPSKAVIEKIVEAAQRAPSGDNCQPWTFSIEEKALRIRHDEARGQHALNRVNHASMISLGCVLESISLMASTFGLKPRIELSEPLGAVVELAAGTEKLDPLALSLVRRETDRRPYTKGDPRHPVFAALKEDAKRFSRAKLHIDTKLSGDLLDWLEVTDSFLWWDKASHQDFFQWVRFSPKDIDATRDGMSWKNLLFTYGQSRVFRLCGWYPFQLFLNRLGFVREVAKETRKRLRSSTAILGITVPSGSCDDLVEAGRLWLRSWVRLNAEDFGVQPLTCGVFGAFDYAVGVLPTHIDESYRLLFARGQELLRKEIGIGSGELAAILFRTGPSPALPADWRTLRRPVALT